MEVDIDQDWVIQFTGTVDENSIDDHISLERESDHKPLYYEVRSIDPKTVTLS